MKGGYERAGKGMVGVMKETLLPKSCSRGSKAYCRISDEQN